MTFETFALCIEAVRRSQNPEYLGKKFVWLNHFGEPLLNPLLPDFIAHAVANDVEVSFFSNGVDLDGKLFPRSLWRDLARAGLKAVALSAHVKSRGVFWNDTLKTSFRSFILSSRNANTFTIGRVRSNWKNSSCAVRHPPPAGRAITKRKICSSFVGMGF